MYLNVVMIDYRNYFIAAVLKFQNEGHNISYSVPNIIRVIDKRGMRLSDHVTCMGDMKNACKMLAKSHEGKRSHGRPRHV
jgi:hypothetical protein